MAEYININQLWKCETCFHNGNNGCSMGWFGCDHGESYRPAHSKFEIADVAAVVHGRWIEEEEIACDGSYNGVHNRCSACSEWFYDIDGFHYCPNCGCRMDKDGE